MKPINIFTMSLLNYNIRGSFSLLLRERPTFITGMNSLFGVRRRASLHDYMKGNNVDDMRQDWIAVGKYIQKSMQAYGR